MRTSRLLIPLLVSACTPDEIVDDPVLDQDGIVNGYVDPGHPSVGMTYQTGAACTGTLIGPHTVLTAAHCLARASEAWFYDGTYWQRGAAIPHPAFGGGANWEYDIGIISLYSEISLTPTPISIGPTSPGQPLTMVGFGYTSAEGGDFGTKRYAHNAIGSVGGLVYDVPGWGGQSATCFGDSGGPDFRGTTECQIGVHSRTGYPHCAAYSLSTRVDTEVGWILDVAGDAIATCGPACNGSVSGPGFPPGGALQSLSPSGSTLTVCGTRECGFGDASNYCYECGTLTLPGGVTMAGVPFQGYLSSLTGRGSSLELCGQMGYGDYYAYGCVSWAVSGASAAGGLSGSQIVAITGSGFSIQLDGFASCGGGDADYTCATRGSLVLWCGP